MNRDPKSLIHIDQSPSSVESESTDNCLFIENFENLDKSDQIRALTNIILDIIKVEPDDVREAIKSIPKI